MYLAGRRAARRDIDVGRASGVVGTSLSLRMRLKIEVELNTKRLWLHVWRVSRIVNQIDTRFLAWGGSMASSTHLPGSTCANVERPPRIVKG
jgi:hypothetical protein